MPGGILQIVTAGLQDRILMANPHFTHFRIVYHRTTNFSIDSIP